MTHDELTYDDFFEVVVRPASAESAPANAATSPYGFQRRLAGDQWLDMLDIPTGLGKTVAITGAWLYRRLLADATTPRRLVWCLPMRVLVEQTKEMSSPGSSARRHTSTNAVSSRRARTC